MKKWYVVVTALFLVGLAAVVFAATPDPGRPAMSGPAGFKGPVPHHPMMERFLNLSKDQIGKIRDLENRHFAETRDLRYGLALKRLEVRKLFTDPKTDEGALLAGEKDLIALKQKILEARARTMIEWRKILSAEQIRKLDLLPMGPLGHRPMGPSMDRDGGPCAGPGMPGMGPGMMGPDDR